jgi:hypothetical protein
MMDRETIKSFASRMVDNDRVRGFAERAGLYTPPPSMTSTIGREVAMLAAGIGVGAFIMYLLDPEQGRRRRALARDQMNSFVSKAEREIGAKARHYSNRARGVVAQATNAVHPADQPF